MNVFTIVVFCAIKLSKYEHILTNGDVSFNEDWIGDY